MGIKHFSNWEDSIDPEIIQVSEYIIESLIKELKDSVNNAEKILEKSVLAFNKLDEKKQFIYTIEREDICEKLIEIAEEFNIEASVAEGIIDTTRDW